MTQEEKYEVRVRGGIERADPSTTLGMTEKGRAIDFDYARQ